MYEQRRLNILRAHLITYAKANATGAVEKAGAPSVARRIFDAVPRMSPAVAMVTPEPGSPLWWRHMTASKVATVLSLDFEGRAPDCMLDMMAGRANKPVHTARQKANMRQGTTNEIRALTLLGWTLPATQTLDAPRYARLDVPHSLGGPFVGATPDGIVREHGQAVAVVEVKCPVNGLPYRCAPVHLTAGGVVVSIPAGIPIYYWVQMQMQMLCTGLRRALFGTLLRRDNALRFAASGQLARAPVFSVAVAAVPVNYGFCAMLLGHVCRLMRGVALALAAKSRIAGRILDGGRAGPVPTAAELLAAFAR